MTPVCGIRARHFVSTSAHFVFRKVMVMGSGQSTNNKSIHAREN